MKKFAKFLLYTVVFIAIVVGLLRLVLFKTWTIPEDDPWLDAAIRPTLHGGDTVLVMTRGSAGFGDLVRCSDPDNPGDYIVGRIAALSGDRIEITGSTVRVNGDQYAASEACNPSEFTVEHPETGSEIDLQCARVEMGGGWHFVGKGTTQKRRKAYKKKVGGGRVFILSDNRELPYDSRELGTLPLENCQERIVFRLWGTTGWTDSEHRLTIIH